MKILLFLTSNRIYSLSWKLRTRCLDDGPLFLTLFTSLAAPVTGFTFNLLLFHHICTVVNSDHSIGL